jgi:hypothetical protein
MDQFAIEERFGKFFVVDAQMGVEKRRCATVEDAEIVLAHYREQARKKRHTALKLRRFASFVARYGLHRPHRRALRG